MPVIRRADPQEVSWLIEGLELLASHWGDVFPNQRFPDDKMDDLYRRLIGASAVVIHDGDEQ